MLGVMLLASPGLARPPAVPSAVIHDPPRDRKHPAHNEQLLIPSHGVGMNALLFKASGAGPKPTVILMHGLPGNERNLDLAQAIRRAGWNVLAFTYRGAWGSPGKFSIGNAIEDGGAALAFARSHDGRARGIDSRRIVLLGHSMGAMVAALTASRQSAVGLVMIDGGNMGLYGKQIAAGGPRERAAFIADNNDFGNALSGATPATVADELIARGAEWDLNDAAVRLRSVPVLSIFATHGNAAENRAFVAQLRRVGNRRAMGVKMNTDHAFADHRIALSAAVVRWLQQFRRAAY